jgi:20S proteasome alpha/beta subunit
MDDTTTIYQIDALAERNDVGCEHVEQGGTTCVALTGHLADVQAVARQITGWHIEQGGRRWLCCPPDYDVTMEEG